MGMFSDLHKQDLAEQQGQAAPAKPKRARGQQTGETSTSATELPAPRSDEFAKPVTFEQGRVPPATRPRDRSPDRPHASPENRAADDTSERTPERRLITRKSFELFQDQFDTLKRLSLHDQLQGGKGSMSDIVREALDRFIAEKQRQAE